MKNEKEKKNKKKAYILRNFFYGINKITQFDKIFILILILYQLLFSISVYFGAIILRTVVNALETNLSFEQVITDVVIVTLIILPIAILERTLNNIRYYKDYLISRKMSIEVSKIYLNMEYESAEKPEMQDLDEKVQSHLGTWQGSMGVVNYAFEFFGELVRFLIACVILISLNYLLIIIILATAILKFFAENKKKVIEKKEYTDKESQYYRKINYTNAASRNADMGKDFRIYRMDRFIEQERKKNIHEYLSIYKKNMKTQFLINTIVNVLGWIDTLALYGFLVYEVVENGLSLADFTFMVSAVSTMTYALIRAIRCYSNILSCSLNANDYFEYMKLDLRIKDEGLVDIADIEEIEFKDVYYSYYMQEGCAIKGVSFKIKKGEKIALVGFNGAGKTTIVKLLSGLYNPTKGNIYINKIDIRTIKRKTLSMLVAPVFQEAIMFAVSIKENITFQDINQINEEELKKAYKLTNLDKKISNLPKKDLTVLSKDYDIDGINLSGGETQKVNISRAIYKNASLYILDEPTSAMDALGEYELYNNLNKIVKDKMTIFISHRLSSTKFCDKIIFINEGKITDIGTHNELMSYDNEYKKLFTTQADYYVNGEEK